MYSTHIFMSFIDTIQIIPLGHRQLHELQEFLWRRKEVSSVTVDNYHQWQKLDIIWIYIYIYMYIVLSQKTFLLHYIALLFSVIEILDKFTLAFIHMPKYTNLWTQILLLLFNSVSCPCLTTIMCTNAFIYDISSGHLHVCGAPLPSHRRKIIPYNTLIWFCHYIIDCQMIFHSL